MSPRRHNRYEEEVELGELSPRNLPFSYQVSPPSPAPIRSGSRAVVDQPGFNSPTGRNPDIQVYSTKRESPDHDDRYGARDIDNTQSSGYLEAPRNNRSQLALSVAPSDFTVGSWNMPAGFEHKYDDIRQSTYTEAETIISNDGLKGDSERNQAEYRRMKKQKERERDERT